ncbi:uracil-DNA glycosylase family protein [Marinobacterium jannaschii]|uniref:uracil-DNA glycosylase family protein n=1 Tax=Marinobacterium jannaschii TaxID=64970 RepID=UPI00056D6D49|nr:uracil-DNA glycosylase family protein [Marinobacterium jannaschii]
MSDSIPLHDLLTQIRQCDLCKEQLPLGPNPVVRASSSARILIIGQAPGTRVHASGIPWDDASGKRLRQWLNLSDEAFYDQSRIAIVPMGFCYPGKGRSGDLPPRPECAPKWHHLLLQQMPDLELTLLIGQYAQKYYLQDQYKTLTERVSHWQEAPDGIIPLPHPSPRNQIWLKRNPWFEQQLVPELQRRIKLISATA